VISNAGNQLVGEALYLRKPMMVLPEKGNFEQSVNGHLLRLSGGGDWFDLQRVTAADLDRFIQAIPHYRSRIRPEDVVGNDDALAVIREEISRAKGPSSTVEATRAA
jgi:UDP:flavonoid glycosyltransferase YjiC (YdhE family)